MPVSKRIILISFAILLCINSHAQQYFTVKGRNIYDENGAVFIPRAMTYMLYLTHNSAINLSPTLTELQNDYYLSPNFHYGVSENFEYDNQVDCNNQIEQDLIKIQSLGFNTVRFTFRAWWNPVGSLQADKFYVKSFENCGDIDLCWSDNNFVPMTKDPTTKYDNDPLVVFLKQRMDDIITIATNLNLKIELEIGTGSSRSGQTADFIDLLQNITSHYSTNTSIISYNTASEPLFSEAFASKGTVCDWTTQWYDAIKAVDPNHLICTHGHIEDISGWDPSVIKADYYKIHPYPELKDYEKLAANYDELQAAINRFKLRVYWLRNYCPKPVMIGETGFRAIDPLDTSYPQPYNPFDYDGSLADQLDYATAVYQHAFDCECMGFTWWGYQDDWNWKEVGFALLGHGAIPSSPPDLLDKPVASAFSSLPTPVTGNCALPANYKDPFNCGMFNSDVTSYVTGTILDDNGNPIKGGVVQALNWLFYDPLPLLLKDRYIHSWLYNCADDNGNFEVIPYNPTPFGAHRIVYIQGSSPGAEKFEAGETWGSVISGGWSDIQMQTSPTIPPLAKINFDYDGIFDGETINQGNTKDLKGWNSVTVSNTTINGTSDITAREEINIGSEFHASNTSEVHIYPSDAFIECSLLSGFLRVGNNAASIEQNEKNNQKEIEVNFNKKQKPGFAIIPNPNSGTFNLEIYDNKDGLAFISIKDPLGNELKKITSTETNIFLNLHTLAKGVYFIEVVIDNKRMTKKLIVN